MSTGIGQCPACGGLYDDESPCRCEAVSIVEQRAQHYGDPRPNLERIAGLWSAYIGRTLTAHDVAQMMVLLKVARAKIDPWHEDNYVDMVGYAEIAQQVR